MSAAVTLIASATAILALVNVAKQTGLPAKLTPLLALILGVGIQAGLWAMGTRTGGLAEMLAAGALAGLSASGAWDVAKKVSPTDTSTDPPRHAAE